MPHLSPMNWPSALMTFWLTLMLLYSMIWWLQLPAFPKIKFTNQKTATNKWNWK